ncbi:MAG: bacteriocin-protection protein [Pyrinomonadaceae bacterium]|nr:bacteriocin-protection protein [Pyrinomonadaceae bacterium]
MTKTIFFENQQEWRDWLRENHQGKDELWVGYYKKATGLPTMTWSESVDQALCFGWIDGLRKSIDDKSYKIRFTPRRPTSKWSDVNIKKIAELKKKKLIRKAGLEAWSKRKEANSGVYSYEKQPKTLSPEMEKHFRKNKKAWAFFSDTPAGYRRTVIGWVMSAKREDTRKRRLEIVIKHSGLEEKIPQYDWKKKED